MDDYLEHLLRDGPADGLEVLLVLIALNITINVVLDDVIWATNCKGIDFCCPTVLLSTSGAYACLLQDLLEGNLADLDMMQTDSTDHDAVQDSTPLDTGRPQGGHPLTVKKDITSESGSTTDTNLDNEFTTDTVP